MIFVGQIVFDLWTLTFLKIVEISVLALSICLTILKTLMYINQKLFDQQKSYLS